MSEQFEGFDSPGTTATPDYVFDFLLKELTGNELKVLMYIIRRTFGFGKSADAISLSQFREGIKTKDGRVLNVGCGIGHNRLILAALAGLEKKGYVISQKKVGEDGSKDTTIYKLRFKKAEQVVTPSNEVVTSGNQGGSYFMPQGVVTSGNQQETHVEQETLRESVVVTDTDSQSTITPTLPDVALDYTTRTQPSMQLSTATEQNVDNSHENHSQQSYSHRHNTSPATHIGVMPVFEVPVPPGVKIPDAPPSEDLDEKKRLGLIAESIREKAPDLSGITIPVLKFIDAWDRGKYGPCSLSRWEVSNAKDIVRRMKGTIEDALLIADELQRQNKTVKIETVCNCWHLLASLKKPVVSSNQPKAFNADDLSEDVWA